MYKTKRIIRSFILGVPVAIIFDYLINYLFIIETPYHVEYRFPKLSWLLDFFFDGHHHLTNGLYFFFILLLGILTAYKLLGYIKK